MCNRDDCWWVGLNTHPIKHLPPELLVAHLNADPHYVPCVLNMKPLNLQATFLSLRPNHGGTLRITAGAYRLISSAYSPRRRMRQCIMCLGHKRCGLASSRIPGSGLTGATHHSVFGNPLSQATLTVSTAPLPYSKMGGSGTT